MKRFKGKCVVPFKEIAVELGISERKARDIYSHAIEKLRDNNQEIVIDYVHALATIARLNSNSSILESCKE